MHNKKIERFKSSRITGVALTMLMPRNKKLNVKEYWSTNDLLHSPIFAKHMSRDQYLQINRHLHFTNKEDATTPYNHLHRIKLLLNMIKQGQTAFFCPFRNLAIDESMVLFKGSLSFKQYIKTKRHLFWNKTVRSVRV